MDKTGREGGKVCVEEPGHGVSDSRRHRGGEYRDEQTQCLVQVEDEERTQEGGWGSVHRVKFGTLNCGVRGIVDEMDVVKLATVIEMRGIDVMGVPETWRGEEDRDRKDIGVKKSDEEIKRDRNLLGDEYVWVERVRMKGTRGGVGIAVRKTCGIVRVVEEWSNEEVLWVCIQLRGGGLLYVCCVYLRSTGGIEGSLSCLAKGLAMTENEGMVVVMGDVNGRIGRLPNKVGGGVVERVSDDPMVNPQGREVMTLMNECGMVVMNGVGGEETGRCTCRGASVVDWMAVRLGMMATCGMVEVEEGWMSEGGRADGDHNLVMIVCEYTGDGSRGQETQEE